MRKIQRRKVKIKAETLRHLSSQEGRGGEVRGGVVVYTATNDEACSGPCCTQVTVSWCA